MSLVYREVVSGSHTWFGQSSSLSATHDLIDLRLVILDEGFIDALTDKRLSYRLC
jgi:hypothetical protein